MPVTEKKIYRLHFTGPLHLSKGKQEYDQSETLLHSDTLKSALFACALQLYGKEKVNERFLTAFTISSAFPFYKGEYFFPKPQVRLQSIAHTLEEKQGKKLKKIQFLGKAYFEDLLQGGLRTIQENHLHDGGRFVTDHPDIIQQKDISIIKATVQQRVAISHDAAEDPTPYYVERLFFGEGAGLYFMLDYSETAVADMVFACLKFLGDNGLGTDRTVGNGQFEAEEATLEMVYPDKANKQVAMSLYCPLPAEVTEEILTESSYQLIKRGGYLSSPEDVANMTLRKRAVYMFSEGSVFPACPALKGKLLDLKPEIKLVQHPVWREGRAMFLPINVPEA